ncbi:ATP-binding protein [Microbacterium album]|uniref:Two-component system sensor kinase n=1 Tax=Microbacterium album TaxID=2053191 RepID=A0A917IHR2_9MICO|nr:ATP-binding protein [Microbacterium album]GGH49984.1 putative two-component system sensor kinase [Microbacterium album]
MTAFPAPAAPLVRPRAMVVSGVARGVADHLGWRPDAARALFVASSAVFGAGALLYVWLWAFTPLERGAARVTRRVPVAWGLLAAAAVSYLAAVGRDHGNTTVGGLPPASLLPVYLAIALAVAAGLWSALADRADPERGPRQDVIARSAATVVLLATVPMLLDAAAGSSGELTLVLLATVLLAVLGVAVVWSSVLVARLRELQAARVKSIRDEHRAEMAAHLHDSVLQTLALIQNRAGASSEAGRLARAQERELRAWLYDGDTPADSDLATDLRDYGSALELDYECVFTVVSAGTSTERASGEVAAAAREAMLNAARHAGGDVSVYIEGSHAAHAAGGAVDVYVRDRGPGFDPQAVPPDRLGVRESIVGRMRRIGGAATVGVGPGGVGTQVHIRYPAAPAQGGARG